MSIIDMLKKINRGGVTNLVKVAEEVGVDHNTHFGAIRSGVVKKVDGEYANRPFADQLPKKSRNSLLERDAEKIREETRNYYKSLGDSLFGD